MKRTTKKTFLCALFTFGLLHNPLAQEMTNHLVNTDTRFSNTDIQDKHIIENNSSEKIGSITHKYNIQLEIRN